MDELTNRWPATEWWLKVTRYINCYTTHITRSLKLKFTSQLESLTRHETSSTVCLQLYSDGSSMLFHCDLEIW